MKDEIIVKSGMKNAECLSSHRNSYCGVALLPPSLRPPPFLNPLTPNPCGAATSKS